MTDPKTEPSGFWRRLVWRYDGKPDPNREDPAVRVVGWGPMRLPGERARLHRCEDEAREMLRIAETLDERTWQRCVESDCDREVWP